MKRQVAIIGTFLFLITQASPLFAQNQTSQMSKELAMQLAFEEEAMRIAFQEAEIKIIEKEVSPPFSIQPHPYAYMETEYNDNIFKIPRSIDGDMVTKITPGIRFVLSGTGKGSYKLSKMRDNSLAVDLGMDMMYYVFNSRLNRQYPYAILTGSLKKGRYKLLLGQSFKKIYSTSSDIVVDSKGITNYQVYNTLINLERDYKRLGWDFNYSRDYYDYTGQYRESSSYSEQICGFTALLKPTALPKTDFLIEYDYGWVDYTKTSSKSKDNEYYKIYLGLKGELAGKTTGYIKLGYEDRNSLGTNSYSSFIASIQLDYQYSPKTKYLLKFLYEPKQGTYITDTLGKSTTLSLDCLHSVRRYALSAALSYDRDEYKSGRIDNIYGFASKISYTFKDWIRVGLGYRLQERSSDNKDVTYTNNICSLDAELTF